MDAMKLWTNGCDWVVAEHEADAADVWAMHTGEFIADYDHVWREDKRPAITIVDPDDKTSETHSAAEWCAMGGRRYLWCTEE